MPKQRPFKNNAHGEPETQLPSSPQPALPFIELDDSPRPRLIRDLENQTSSMTVAQPTNSDTFIPALAPPPELVRPAALAQRNPTTTSDPGRVIYVPISAQWHNLGIRPVLLLTYPEHLDTWIWDGPTTGISYLHTIRMNDIVATALLPNGLLGVLTRSSLTIYSLSDGNFLHQMSFDGTGSRLTAARARLVIGTTEPFALHVVCAWSWKIIYTIPADDLIPALQVDEPRVRTSSPLDHPIYAHSGRYLAFTCRRPNTAATPASLSASPTSATSSAALALGETALTVLRFGGRALSAAMKRFDAEGAGKPKFFSTSAPAGTATATPGSPTSESSNPAMSLNHGAYIRVMDLEAHGTPRILSEFLLPSVDSISSLSFAPDCITLSVASHDGRKALLFKLRINACLTRLPDASHDLYSPIHQYTLHRGLTSASISHTGWASDGSWVGLATRNRTVHVFKIEQEHTGQMEDLNPVLRSRHHSKNKANHTEPEQPIAFTFITIPPHSPTHTHLLLYDPQTNVLSLRHITLTSKDHSDVGGSSLGSIGGALSLPTSLSITSSSLPLRFSGTAISPTFKFLSSSPSSTSGAIESTVASWILNHSSQPLPPVPSPVRTTAANYLAQCELTTSFSSKPLYLSHQLTFYTLGVEFQTLIRGQQLHIRDALIPVRRQVAVSIHPSERTTSAIEGHFEATDIDRRVLPMLPNGYPNNSVRKGIPIGRVVGIGREVVSNYHASRSPRSPSDGWNHETELEASAGVSLEFDDEDEDFADTPPLAGQLSTVRVVDGTEHEEDLWHLDDVPPTEITEPDPERQLPAEEFEHIEVLGVLDEEEEERRQQERQRQIELSEKKKRKKKGKR